MRFKQIIISFLTVFLLSISACKNNNKQSIFPSPDYTYCDYFGTISNNEYFSQSFSLGPGNYIFMGVTAKTTTNYHFFFVFCDFKLVDYNDIFVNSYSDFTFLNGIKETYFAEYRVENSNEQSDIVDMYVITFDKQLQKDETFYFCAAYKPYSGTIPPPETCMYVEITSGDFPFSPYLIPTK